MGLISGTANGKDFNFPKDKIISYRNFANKIWNMARFMLYMFDQNNINRYSDLIEFSKLNKKELTQNDKQIIKGFKNLKVSVDKKLNKFRFADAADSIYHFMWEDLASNYLESIKNRKDVLTALSVYRYIYLNSLKLSHPFMPFITEAIWGELKKYRKYPKQLLISSSWPQVKE
jgi:valyl-tRNA synthetase